MTIPHEVLNRTPLHLAVFTLIDSVPVFRISRPAADHSDLQRNQKPLPPHTHLRSTRRLIRSHSTRKRLMPLSTAPVHLR